jgi:hypothetical protein
VELIEISRDKLGSASRKNEIFRKESNFSKNDRRFLDEKLFNTVDGLIL